MCVDDSPKISSRIISSTRSGDRHPNATQEAVPYHRMVPYGAMADVIILPSRSALHGIRTRSVHVCLSGPTSEGIVLIYTVLMYICTPCPLFHTQCLSIYIIAARS